VAGLAGGKRTVAEARGFGRSQPPSSSTASINPVERFTPRAPKPSNESRAWSQEISNVLKRAAKGDVAHG